MATIFHNPRCSKSRQTLELLRERGVEPDVVEYLKTPPSKEKLAEQVQALGISPTQLLRTKEAPYAELELGDAARTDDEILQAMVDHPILIERPIVVTGKGVRLGRPPEKVLEIL